MQDNLQNVREQLQTPQSHKKHEIDPHQTQTLQGGTVVQLAGGLSTLQGLSQAQEGGEGRGDRWRHYDLQDCYAGQEA